MRELFIEKPALRFQFVGIILIVQTKSRNYKTIKEVSDLV